MSNVEYPEYPELNRDFILQLADNIEKLSYMDHEDPFGTELHFDMAVYQYECGTPACIAGWAVWQIVDGDVQKYRGMLDDDRIEQTLSMVKRIMGLTKEEASDLFQPDNRYADFGEPPNERRPHRHISPERAAAQLRHFVETCTVDWSVTCDMDMLEEYEASL